MFLDYLQGTVWLMLLHCGVKSDELLVTSKVTTE